MVETRHVRLDYEQALSAKKQLLTSEINLLHILKKIRTYKLLRKKELTLKSGLRVRLKSLKTKINSIYSYLPTEGQKTVKIKRRKKIVEKSAERGIQGELEDIKRKLARLS